MPSARPSRAAIAAALIAVYFFWGSTYLGIRYALDTLPPFLMTSARFLFAGAVLLAFARWRRVARAGWRQLAAAAGAGTLMLVTGNGAVVWAEQTVPSGLVALTSATSPIWMVVANRVFFGNRITWPAALGMGIGLAGMFVLINPSAGLIPLLPSVVLLFSSAGWALGTVLSRSRAMPASTVLANGTQVLAGGIAFALIAVLVGDVGHFEPRHASLASVAGLAWLSVFGSLVGFSCYLWLIRVAPVPLVATQSYVSPAVAVALGALLRHEIVTTRELLAGAIIIVGVILVASAPLLSARPAGEELAAA